MKKNFTVLLLVFSLLFCLFLFCGCESNDSEGSSDSVEHSFGDPTYVWTDDYSECLARRICSVCGQEESEQGTVTKTLTSQSENHTYTYTASFTNESFTTCQKSCVLPHVFDLELAEPQFLYAEQSCLSPETYYKSCICGEKSTETFTTDLKNAHKIIDGKCIFCERADLICEHYTVETILLEKTDGFSSPCYCSCNQCDTTFYKDLSYQDINMPILYFDSKAFEATSAKNIVEGITVKYTSENKTFEDTCSLKVQGSTSTIFPKTNYNIKFSSKIKLVDEWGKQKKYCLKANYVDFSQARNIVSAKLYGQIVHSRGIEDEVDELVNGGAIDGYPVLIYIDNAYHGLYTLNIPKDNWLMGMKASDNKDQAMLSTNRYNDSVRLKTGIAENYESDGWEFEFYSNEESETDSDCMWAIDGMNNLITFVNSASDEELIRDLHQYIKIERTIDAFLLTCFICAADNYSKNIIWITYDGGGTWQPSIYDMDGAWGLMWNGTLDIGAETYDCLSADTMNRVWRRMYSCFYNEIVARYQELRLSVLSYDNIASVLGDFQDQIYAPLFDLEKIKWKNVPSNDMDHYAQMLEYAQLRLTYLDSYFTLE